jgi:hypothetical protein
MQKKLIEKRLGGAAEETILSLGEAENLKRAKRRKQCCFYIQTQIPISFVSASFINVLGALHSTFLPISFSRGSSDIIVHRLRTICWLVLRYVP